ncbi:MAG: RNA polymerase sigma factor [Cyclobacteriaceae bacterium]
MQGNFKRILKRAAKGHKQSQYELYESFYGYCMSVALRFCNSREESKEVVHDSFIKAFAKLGSVANEDSFKPWLRRIVVNTSIDYYRKNSNEIHHLDVMEHDSIDLEENALDKLSAEDIYKAIELLPPAYRMVFTLYAVEGYKHDEIGEKLGISTGTSKSNLSKARVKLQKLILDMNKVKQVSNG